MRWMLLFILILPLTWAHGDELPGPGEDAGWAQLEALVEQAGVVETYQAAFTQEKFTPLLVKPIVSQGTVRIVGRRSRWDTVEPYPTTMLITGGGVLQMYYPQQKTLEIYELGDRLDAMAASPVPDLGQLRQSFRIDAVSQVAGEDDAPPLLRVELIPRNDDLEKAIESVTVLLDPARALLTQLEVTDVDGETTLLRFTDVQINPPLDAAALDLQVPEGTTIVRPLEGLGE